ERRQRRVVRPVLPRECLERAAMIRIVVRIAGTWRVEADRALVRLHARNLAGVDEQELRRRIDEPPDQPGGGGAVDADAAASDPLQGANLLCSIVVDAGAAAAQRVAGRAHFGGAG